MQRRILCGVLLAVAACGDNSNECDRGTTMNVDGVCVGNQTVCSDGTILVDGKCEIDPAACQGGTVLVGDACVDPGVMVADLEEGAEPNGLGLIESSTAPAGEIMLKPAGSQFVIHGKIAPFRDDDADGQTDADIDTYFVEVTSPTLITVSADGLNGLAGGFISVANVASTDPLSDWTRFGVNLTGDTSKRQLYLPEAGVYLLAIGDSRTLLLSGGAAGAKEGAPPFEYYVSIEQTAATAQPLTVTNGVATSTGMRQPGEVKLFSVAMGEGFNRATLESPQVTIRSSVLITRTRAGQTTLRALGDGDDSTPAEASALGIRTGDTSIVVADAVIDYSNQPTSYELTIDTGTAGALSTTGQSVDQPASATQLSTFYYDVAPDGLLIGLDLAFNKPVTGVVVNEDLFIFSFFTFDPSFGFAFGDTFQSYRGLMRHADPGRYYFLVFDPTFTASSPAANLTATSRYGSVAPATIVKGTPLTNQAINIYESNPFTYAPGTVTDPWQRFTGSGTGSGTITASYFEPTAIGRLDTLVNDCGAPCNDRPLPVFEHTYVAGGTTRERILLDNASLTSLLVVVNTATVTGSPTFNLDIAPQTNVNLVPMVMVGTPVSDNDNLLDATTTLQRFIVRTAAGNGLTLSAMPDVNTLDTRIQRVNVDGSANGAGINNGAIGAADTAIGIQGTSGFTAFTVDAAAGNGTFDLTATATAPVTYMTAAGATAFVDACVNGATVAMSDLDDGRSTATISTPTGFDYFGFSAPALRVFSNGFLSLDANLACANFCFFSNADMPNANAPNAIVAPYWDDLDLTSVCQQTTGTKLTIQWTGTVLDEATQVVSMQAIVDGSNDTIEFVYGPTHTAPGTSSTIGIENPVGSAARKLSFNAANASPNTLFSPM